MSHILAFGIVIGVWLAFFAIVWALAVRRER